ncbi:MAG: hypothetical protein AAF639_23350 [Chloroflexota bacterium]
MTNKSQTNQKSQRRTKQFDRVHRQAQSEQSDTQEHQPLGSGPSSAFSGQPSELMRQHTSSLQLSRSHERSMPSTITTLDNRSETPTQFHHPVNFAHVPASVQRKPKKPQNQLPVPPVSPKSTSTSPNLIQRVFKPARIRSNNTFKRKVAVHKYTEGGYGQRDTAKSGG